jgi:hypothetical protein
MTMNQEKTLSQVLVEQMQRSSMATDKPSPSRIVQVRIKVNYGTAHFYPVNPTADLFLRIQGGKTLTKATLKILKDEGYTIQYTYEEPSL